jgi:pimeloyl-ACP methyl ester carboxylesterase
LCCNKFYFFHLSNFSESTFTDTPYSLNDYAMEIDMVLDKLAIENANFVGHSAGGRIVLYYTAYNQSRVRNLALLNAAGLKHPDATERMVERARHYFTKLNSVTEPEEKILRETFKNLYNAHITDYLPLIKNPVLIIWGRLDKTISVSRAYTFKEHLPHAELVIYDDLGHDTLSDPRVVHKLLHFINDI